MTLECITAKGRFGHGKFKLDPFGREGEHSTLCYLRCLRCKAHNAFFPEWLNQFRVPDPR